MLRDTTLLLICVSEGINWHIACLYQEIGMTTFERLQS